MKITKTKIQASSDFRSFNKYSIDEVEELFPEVLEFYPEFLDGTVVAVFLQDGLATGKIAFEDTDGVIWVWIPTEGWYESDLTVLDRYFNSEETI